MNIQSTRNIRKTRNARVKKAPDQKPSPKPEGGGGPNESWAVPRLLSKPRGVLSASIKMTRASEGFGLMKNPFSLSLQNTVSTFGIAFYGANVAAEALDGDYKGALQDVGNGAVSFTAGAKLLGAPINVSSSMYAAGGALNLGLAIDELKHGETVTGLLRLGNAVGMFLSAANGFLGASPLAAVVGPASLAVLGTVGFATIIRDLTDNGFHNRPDMFT